MAEDLALFSSLFQGEFPDEWRRDPEFSKYLAELTSFSVKRLRREPDLIKDEQDCVFNSTQKLAFNNYKTFIQTAVCSRDVFADFIAVEGHLKELITTITPFVTTCKNFGKDAQEIISRRKLNSLALSKHTQLLEVLEIPQLMETCVRNGYYEEALELSTHVKRMEKKHTNIPIIANIASDTEHCRDLMLSQLVQQLQGSLQLPACLRLVGLLKRMSIFTETQLRLKFLQARDHWLQSMLNTVPKDDPYLHITKSIEMYRVHLFDIVTQYKAIFPDDDSILAGIHGNSERQVDGSLFSNWLNSKIWQFLQVLESDLMRGVGSRIDSLLSQCMYFGLSFSRVGADFRPLVMPIFIRVTLQTFQLSVRDAKHHFHESMKHFSLSQSVPSFSSTFSSSSSFLTPPHSLLSYAPLLILTNKLIASFNELRACAPVAIAPPVASELERLMQSTIHDIGEYYKIEHSTFTQNEALAFQQFCRVIIVDFLPFIEQCLSMLFTDEAVQQIASCTLLMGSHTHRKDKTFTSRTALRKAIHITFGISASKLAEPLRALVPEIFDELEQQKLQNTITNLKSPHVEESKEHFNIDDEKDDTHGLNGKPNENDVVEEILPIDQQIQAETETPPLNYEPTTGDDTGSMSLPVTTDSWQDFSIDDEN